MIWRRKRKACPHGRIARRGGRPTCLDCRKVLSEGELTELVHQAPGLEGFELARWARDMGLAPDFALWIERELVKLGTSRAAGQEIVRQLVQAKADQEGFEAMIGSGLEAEAYRALQEGIRRNRGSWP